MLVEILEGIGTPNPRVTPLGWVLAIGVLLIAGTILSVGIILPLMRLETQMIVGLPIWIFVSGVLLSIISLMFLNRKKVFYRILSGTLAIAGGVLFFTFMLALAGD